MTSSNVLQFTPDEAREIPMVDLAFAVLKNTNNPMYYRDLMQEIARIKGISDNEVMQVIAQVYTEINIDGRFACVGNNLWGLKRWYPVERSEDTVGSGKHPRIINDDDDDDLDDDTLFADEVEEYSADDEDYDKVDGERDEFEEEADDIDEEVEEGLDEELEAEEAELEEEELPGEELDGEEEESESFDDVDEIDLDEEDED